MNENNFKTSKSCLKTCFSIFLNENLGFYDYLAADPCAVEPPDPIVWALAQFPMKYYLLTIFLRSRRLLINNFFFNVEKMLSARERLD